MLSFIKGLSGKEWARLGGTILTTAACTIMSQRAQDDLIAKKVNEAVSNLQKDVSKIE